MLTSSFLIELRLFDEFWAFLLTESCRIGDRLGELKTFSAFLALFLALSALKRLWLLLCLANWLVRLLEISSSSHTLVSLSELLVRRFCFFFGEPRSGERSGGVLCWWLLLLLLLVWKTLSFSSSVSVSPMSWMIFENWLNFGLDAKCSLNKKNSFSYFLTWNENIWKNYGYSNLGM